MVLGFAVLGAFLYEVFRLLKLYYQVLNSPYLGGQYLEMGLVLCAVAIAITLVMQYGLWKQKASLWIENWVVDHMVGRIIWTVVFLISCFFGLGSIILLIILLRENDLVGLDVPIFSSLCCWYYIFWNITAFVELLRE